VNLGARRGRRVENAALSVYSGRIVDARASLILALLVVGACTSRATVKNQKVSESDGTSAGNTTGSGGGTSDSEAVASSTSATATSSAGTGGMTTGTDPAQGGSAGDPGDSSTSDNTTAGTAGTTDTAGAGGSTDATGGGGTSATSGTGGTGGNSECANLLVDGGFEAMPSEWTAWSNNERELIAHASDEDLFIAPQAGEHVAWVGVGENETSTLEQDFTVPVDTDILTLTGYLWIATEENDFDGPFDFAGVELAQGDALRVESEPWSNDDKTAGWAPFTVELEVTPYRGMRMTFRLWADSDDNLPTSFWFDSLALLPCAP